MSQNVFQMYRVPLVDILKKIGFKRNKGFQILMRMKVSFQNKSLQIAKPYYY